MKKKPTITDDMLSNAPKEEEMTIASERSATHPLGSEDYAAGDSVNEHKNLERANLYLDEGEISQQNNNL
ncbi:hypothetical protein [Fictibacillus fluitans]|uniref:DUF4025 domain-containing protein n=1 Tax=Fictibacillus fluitans TaxID=3058422 RepID=A0ABT8HSX0_9BACL|nr:hypothetical protein [Fictibacillus sp. NE201]MDN4523870.1 hypothetical protein [Fictibacillus sp. NE201]